MITPALLDAGADTRLKGAPAQIFLYLHRILPLGEYRPLKIWPIAEALKMQKNTVGRALNRLVDCGYMREGERTKPGGRSYLLLSSRGAPTK